MDDRLYRHRCVCEWCFIMQEQNTRSHMTFREYTYTSTYVCRDGLGAFGRGHSMLENLRPKVNKASQNGIRYRILDTKREGTTFADPALTHV